MRTTLMIALALLGAGCKSNAPPRFPAPASARDGKTPVALERPVISQRITEQRIRDGQVAQGDLKAQGQLVR